MNDVTQIWTFTDPPPSRHNKTAVSLTPLHLVSQKLQPPPPGFCDIFYANPSIF